jgi:hypothetical protein
MTLINNELMKTMANGIIVFMEIKGNLGYISLKPLSEHYMLYINLFFRNILYYKYII